jgi:hypothetical protein
VQALPGIPLCSRLARFFQLGQADLPDDPNSFLVSYDIFQEPNGRSNGHEYSILCPYRAYSPFFYLFQAFIQLLCSVSTQLRLNTDCSERGKLFGKMALIIIVSI